MINTKSELATLTSTISFFCGWQQVSQVSANEQILLIDDLEEKADRKCYTKHQLFEALSRFYVVFPKKIPTGKAL